MKTIEITCATCSKITQKKLAEIKRQQKKGKTKFYCSISCASKQKINHLKPYQQYFKTHKYTYSKLDEYSDFKWYIKVAKKTSKQNNKNFNIDCKYLKELWLKQNGLCPITNQKLELRTYRQNSISHPYSASIDRIDCSKGYIKGNVRFVALIFNYARNIFSDDQVIDFCKKVTEYHTIQSTHV